MPSFGNLESNLNEFSDNQISSESDIPSETEDQEHQVQPEEVLNNDVGHSINKKDIDKRIEKEGVPEEIIEKLIQLPQSTLTSLLLRLTREKTSRKRPNDIVAEYISKEETFANGTFNQFDLIELQYKQLQEVKKYFETIELSPVVPQGLNAVITRVSPDVSMATIRNSEIIGDPTTALALETAKRRKKQKNDTINIATSQRVLRMQPIASEGFLHHFLLLGLSSSGKNYERADDPFAFLTDNFSKHINTHLEIIQTLNQSGYNINDVEVLFSDLVILEDLIRNTGKERNNVIRNSLNDNFDLLAYLGLTLPEIVESVDQIDHDYAKRLGIEKRLQTLKRIEERVFVPLKTKFQDVKFGTDFSRKAGLGYYDKTCFHIFGTNGAGQRIQISDGGKVDWVAKMAFDRKELSITSGMGTEFIERFFK